MKSCSLLHHGKFGNGTTCHKVPTEYPHGVSKVLKNVLTYPPVSNIDFPHYDTRHFVTVSSLSSAPLYHQNEYDPMLDFLFTEIIYLVIINVYEFLKLDLR